jgi:3-deoxy-D-manno-octulosonic-acid transferase
LLLLNARMSERSALGYGRFARLTRGALGRISAIAAQTPDDAARLTRLGAKNVSVMGNLKFDIDPPPAMLELGEQLRKRFGTSRRIFLAASTREGEEILLLDMLQNIHVPGLLLVIVPRHPQRFNEVSELIAKRGITFQLRSENSAVKMETRIILGDSMGEMFAYYAAADLAFIGGSLMPYGGQNLIEACAVGTPVLVGPHMYNFAEATRLAVSAGAALQISNAEQLAAEAQQLFQDATLLHEMHRHCAKFIESNRGATEKSVQLVKQFHL